MTTQQLRYTLTLEVDLDGKDQPIEGDVACLLRDALLDAIPHVLLDSEDLDLLILTRSATLALDDPKGSTNET